MDSMLLTFSEALYSLGLEKNNLDILQENLSDAKEIFDTENDVFKLLKSESVALKERYVLVDKFFEPFEEDSKSFLKVLIKSHVINRFNDIKMSFDFLVNNYNNVEQGIIYSVNPLSKKTIEEFEKTLGEKLSKKVSLSNRIDTLLIGGVKIVLSESVYDDSIKKKIEDLKKSLYKKEVNKYES